MASSDVFVSPSETETFGNTVVEAQASGLPVVVASRGAARENMIHEITGLVVDARRPQELATAISGLLVDRRRRTLMAEAASAFARRYGMDSAADGTFDEYRRFMTEWAQRDAARAAAPTPEAPLSQVSQVSQVSENKQVSQDQQDIKQEIQPPPPPTVPAWPLANRPRRNAGGVS
jgi:hypothetical protein